MDHVIELTTDIEIFAKAKPSKLACLSTIRHYLTEIDKLAMIGVPRGRFGSNYVRLRELAWAGSRAHRVARQAYDIVVTIIMKDQLLEEFRATRSEAVKRRLYDVYKDYLTDIQYKDLLNLVSTPGQSVTPDYILDKEMDSVALKQAADALTSLEASIRDLAPDANFIKNARSLVTLWLSPWPTLEYLWLFATVDAENPWPDYAGDVFPPIAVQQWLRSGLRVFLTTARGSPTFRQWLGHAPHTLSRASSTVLQAFRHIFGGHDQDNVAEDEIRLTDAAVANAAVARCVAASAGYGAPAQRDLAEFIIETYLVGHQTDTVAWDDPIRAWVWSLYKRACATNFTVPEKLSQWLLAIRDWVGSEYLPTGIFAACSNVITATCVGLYELVEKLSEVVVYIASKIAGPLGVFLDEYFLIGRAFLSGLLPEHRRRRKAAWAPLFGNTFYRLTPAEKFAIACKTMAEAPDVTPYSLWASQRIADFNRIQDKVTLLDLDPIRPMHLPTDVLVVEKEMAALAPLMSENMRVDEKLTQWVKSWLDRGVPRGIDGTWFATGERIATSISRYNIERPISSEPVRAVVLQAAHTLANRNPEMYKNAVYLTPQAAMRKIKEKYSPGLPLIPQFKNRKQLAQLGLLKASADLAEEYLLRGVHPGTAAHAFPKMDIIGLQKLLDGKNVRTVIAQELVGNILMWTSSMETTRRQPPKEAWVMNATPRSEGGFRDFFERLEKHARVIAADGTEFDSKLAPVITVDGLVELRSLGFASSPIHDVVHSQIKANYKAMLVAPIVDLTTGKVFPKTGGLMTGSANTATDNRDAFRLMILSAWSLATGQPCENFYATNTLGNAGDDDLIGTDDPSSVWNDVFDIIQREFGVTMRLESEGFREVDLVGLKVIDVPQSSLKYYLDKGLDVPAWSIASIPERLMAKRMESRFREAKLRDVAFYMSHINGLIGSGFLTAHIHHVYNDLAEEYIREITLVLSRFFETTHIDRGLNDQGELVSLRVDVGKARPRYQATNLKNIRAWLKNHQWPSYARIMDVWLEGPKGPTSSMNKTHSKILLWNPPIPRADRLLYGLVTVREWLWTIPNQVVRATPEFVGRDITAVMRNSEYLVSKFVWLSLYVASGKVPTDAFYRQVLRENPYATACDPTGFLRWLHSDTNLQRLLLDDLETHRGRMLVATMVYTFIEVIFAWSARSPLLGALVQLYIIGVRDVNRLYAASNHIYMLATGRSSPVISNMMPADPYAWMKQFAVILASLVPKRICGVLGTKYWVAFMPKLVEIWVASQLVVAPPIARHLASLIDIPTRWCEVTDLVLENMDRRLLKTQLVVAPTGTGKSTVFVAALLRRSTRVRSIWVLCPTVLARDNYSNPFVDDLCIQVLTKGVVNDQTRGVKVLTYLHYLAARVIEVEVDDILIFDEPHLGKPEMLGAHHMSHPFMKIQVTATPNPLLMPGAETTIIHSEAKRFSVTSEIIQGDWVDLVQDIATVRPQLLSRALFIVPTVKLAEEIVLTLGRLSLPASILSAEESVPSTFGPIAATTIADTAVTIEPPPTCLIDLGEVLRFTLDASKLVPQYNVSLVASPPSVAQQRLGRVGRAGDSYAFVHPKAGTGEEPRMLATAFDILSIAVATPYLCHAYGILNVLEPINAGQPGVLQWLSLREPMDANRGGVEFASKVLALWIVIRLSAQVELSSIRIELHNLRLTPSPHEIINDLASSVMDVYSTSLFIGDWNVAMVNLHSGCVVCQIAGQAIATGGLVIDDNILRPSGALQSDRLSELYQARPQAVIGSGQAPSLVATNLASYKATLRGTLFVGLTRQTQGTNEYAMVAAPAQFLASPMVETPCLLGQRYLDFEIEHALTQVSLDVLDLLPILIDADSAEYSYPEYLDVSLTTRPMYPGLGSVVVPRDVFGPYWTPVTVCILMAASLPDKCSAVIGAPPSAVIRAFRRGARLSVSNDDWSWWLVRSSVARKWAAVAANSTYLQNPYEALSLVPRDIFVISNRLTSSRATNMSQICLRDGRFHPAT